MPITSGTYVVPNNFVEQYDLGQKKIRADLVDGNFNDAADVINTLLTDDANSVHLTGAETISGNKTFTGTNAFGENTTGITATAGDNSTKFATTAYADNAASTAAAGVAVSPSSSTPAARSASGAVGSSAEYARADHSHPKNWGTSSLVTATAPAVVVKTWHSGTEWYRVWSDGWIEQGGVDSNINLIATINLNKSFSDANYTVVITCAQNVTSSSAYDIGAYNKTTTSFARIGINSSGSANNTTNWYACGF